MEVGPNEARGPAGLFEVFGVHGGSEAPKWIVPPGLGGKVTPVVGG
jgi:hypothetical protein